MAHCKEKQRAWRHPRHRRMPTLGNHKNSVLGSPQHGLFTGFVHIADLRRGRTLDSTRSPAGMHPMTAAINDHLWRLYKELKGHHKTLSRDKFEDFIRNVQGDAKKPSWDFSPNCTSFTFEQFVELWWTEYSVAKRPIHREDKDLDQPISNYFINSSHNTYIKYGNQFSGVNDAEQYVKVLESGCRCVEIDVWDGEEAGEEASRGFTQPGSSTHRESVTPAERSASKHWSFSSMFTWMSERCHLTRAMSFPRTLKSKQSEASFKATPPRRARAISDMADPATIATMLKGEPRVYHAVHTPVGDQALHEAIPFRTVCQKIQKHAFTNGNELPIIISLEVHANISQQKLMVKIMEHEFGERLLKQELPDCDPHTRLPTLRELKGKILIKTKTGHRTVPATLSDSGSTLQGSEPSECGFPLSPKSKSSFSGGSSRHEPVDKVAEAVKKLAIYTYGPGCFKKFSTAKDAEHPAHIYSIGDKTLEKLHRNEHDELFTHNKKFLARSFPDNLSSFDSSNPNAPTLCWRKGVQMVALNWQRWDTAMELNSAMFDNEDGWVLKPEGYRSTESAIRQAQVIGKKRMNLTITVLAGQHVPTQGLADVDGTPMMNPSAVKDKKFRPRVTCFLHVESAAERDSNKALHKDEISRQTKTAKTEHPSWGSSSSKLHFTDVRHVVEELSFVRIHVDDCRRKWHTRTAWACIRLDRLQEGYRLIKLNTDDGLKGDGVLLVKIEKKLVDEHSRLSSLSRKTWDACKTEVSQLKSMWSCMG